MTQLGDFWCKNRKPDSLDCEKGLECPRAHQECNSFEPNGEAILDDITQEWLHETKRGDGLADAMIERLQAAIIKARRW